jgi:hypothetical protein
MAALLRFERGGLDDPKPKCYSPHPQCQPVRRCPLGLAPASRTLAGMSAAKGGVFDGTTAFGGIGAGTIFKLAPAGSEYAESTLDGFTGGTEGAA